MNRRLKFAAIFVALCSLGTPALAQLSPMANYRSENQDFGVPPQDTLHVGAPHAPTPLIVPGARTITTAELYGRLIAQQPFILYM